MAETQGFPEGITIIGGHGPTGALVAAVGKNAEATVRDYLQALDSLEKNFKKGAK